MYRIGEFSTLVKVPIRTLRFYDKFGLLCPDRIDEFTGYRYYSESNILEYELIRLLKSVNFSLEEIKEFKDSINEEILNKKIKEVGNKIIELSKIKKRLESMKKDLEKNNKE